MGSNNGDRFSSRTLHNFSLPPHLTWGSQRLFRCATTTTNNNHHDHRHPSQEDHIISIRDKLMISDLNSQVDKFLGNSPPPSQLPPWNLRTRRSPAMSEAAAPMVEVVNGGGERAKFSVALTKQEVDNDFGRIIGRRPPRKPKKRPRYIQKQLDMLFPGLWLSEITSDMYSVNGNSENNPK